MLIKSKTGEMVVKKKLPIIGCKHMLKQVGVCNSETGDFWIRYPDMTADDLRLQKQLLKRKEPIKVKVEFNFVDEYA